jgi:hypothetical protein
MKQRYKKFDCVKYYSIACCGIKIRFIFAETLTPKQMETAIIIVLAFMLLIAIIISIDISFEIKRLNIKNQACASALDKSNNQNKYLRNKNSAFKIEIDQQHTIFSKENHTLKSTIKFRDSKIIELEKKYKSALDKIVERDEKIQDRDLQIIELEKTKKKYSARVYELHGEKDFAIHQSKSSIKLCNEMSKMFKMMNSELESIEAELKTKLNS